MAEDFETEGGVQRDIQKHASKLGARLFRNETGLFKCLHDPWCPACGAPIKTFRIKTGLMNGAADLVGWKPVVITPDMVGQTVAVFLSVEVKKPKGKKPEKAQRQWRTIVRENGGIAGVARSREDLEGIIDGDD